MDPGSLAQAFEAFTSTADSLQHSYGILQTEVGRLRQELKLRNRDLAHSLAENERMRVRLGHILENLPCGVVALTPQLELHYANDIARRLLASASAASDSVGPIPGSLRRLLRQIISSAPGAEREWVLGEAKDPVFISVTCAQIPQTAESPQELVFILRDITEQKRLEEEREVSRRMRVLAEMTALEQQKKSLRQQLAKLEEQRTSQEQAFREAQRKRKIVENPRDLKLELYRQEEARREQQRVDDLFGLRHGQLARQG